MSADESPIQVEVLDVGAVRLRAPLQPEEARHGLFLRDVDPAVARSMAAELLQAAEEAEQVGGGSRGSAASDALPRG